MKRIPMLLTIVLAMGLISVCAANAGEVVDMTGRTIHVPDKIDRIVSPYRIATKMILALGMEDKLVGISTRPSPVAALLFPNLEKAGIADRHSSVEEILSMSPDIVFTSPGPLVENLEKTGIAVFCIIVENPDTMIRGLGLIAEVLGRTERAEAISTFYQEKMDYIKAQTAGIKEKKRVYIVGARLLTTVGGDFYQDHIIRLAGGINVSHDLKGGWASVNREHLAAWNPQVMVTIPYYSPGLPEEILSDKGLGLIDAVQNRQIFTFPSYIDSWDLPSPESILGIMWLANTLYPEQISFDMNAEARGFYTRFYGTYPIEIALEK
ncbi:MAG: ABC transporter substrate-binding protein [Deltaproteobacteria bacterium]|nr:ABC transporter substrate-binding protein [Deltaproteobacteria bacterium]